MIILVHFNRLKMINVTFTMHFKKNYLSMPWYTRIISTNLEEDRRINPKYHIIFDDEYDIKSIETDIVLVSSSMENYLSYVKLLLRMGKKVVFGGPLLFFINNNELRESLIKLELSEYSKNIIFVKGYVDRTTDLYSIIKNWKDCEIKDYSNIHTVYDCEIDHLLEPNVNPFNDEKYILSFLLNQKCSYNKCRFCYYRNLPIIKYYKDISKVGEHIVKMCNLYKTNKTYIWDSCFEFTKENIELLKFLKMNGIQVFIYIRISDLMNKKKIEYMNKYISQITIGIESTIDFSLEYVKKGYSWDDILISLKNMLKYMKREMAMVFMFILDLPILSKEDIYLNYIRINSMKKILENNGFKYINLIFNSINVGNTSRMIDNKYYKVTEEPTCGISYWEKINGLNSGETVLIKNISRYDSNGILLPSDHDIIKWI